MNRQSKPQRPRFPLGQVVATPGVLAALQASGQAPQTLLRRHHGGDWGDLDPVDWQANDQALRDGSRLFSAYQATADVRVWIITEADRSATTLLLPAEY